MTDCVWGAETFILFNILQVLSQNHTNASLYVTRHLWFQKYPFSKLQNSTRLSPSSVGKKSLVRSVQIFLLVAFQNRYQNYCAIAGFHTNYEQMVIKWVCYITEYYPSYHVKRHNADLHGGYLLHIGIICICMYFLFFFQWNHIVTNYKQKTDLNLRLVFTWTSQDATTSSVRRDFFHVVTHNINT